MIGDNLPRNSVLEEEKISFWITAQQAATLAKKAGARLLVLTHFSARYQELDGFEQEARAIFPTTVVADDLKVIPFPKV